MGRCVKSDLLCTQGTETLAELFHKIALIQSYNLMHLVFRGASGFFAVIHMQLAGNSRNCWKLEDIFPTEEGTL